MWCFDLKSKSVKYQNVDIWRNITPKSKKIDLSDNYKYNLFFILFLDLFYTRVNPSKMFDVLKDDFDYIFISSVLIGMIVVSIVSQKLAARKALNRAWR